MSSRRGLLVLALACVPSLAWSQKAPDAEKLEVDFDRATDFTGYKTYGWAPFQEPVANPANHVRITRAVERELEAKGLTKAGPGEATLLARYQARLEKKVRGTSSQSRSDWQPSSSRVIVNFDKVEIGTLMLELWDAKRKDVVWHAKTVEPMLSPDRIESQIGNAVKRMLDAYPPKAEGEVR